MRSIGGIAGIIFMVACCALAPVILTAVAAGTGAWFTGAGLAGAIALAAALGAVANGIIRWRRKVARANLRQERGEFNGHRL